MSAPLEAAAVHLRTATGAAFALVALIAAAQADWRWMFIWLGVALIVDSIDGPLARRFSVTRVLPRWSGERLDLIVDFLTYVMVPAFALSQADLLPPPWRLPAGIAIVVSSLFHMADQESKTKEGYFVGFPAIWNVVCLYFCIPALAIRRARHRCTFCHAHLRADSLGASLPCRGAALLHPARHGSVGGRRHRRRRQSVSIAALGQSAARRNRGRPLRRRRVSCAARPDGKVTAG